jgi:16S rRNA (cytidine1402-2'-O)-methyltransferase
MVELIASEDPKVTQQFLAHHHIQRTVTSYGPRNLKEKVAVLLQRLQQGTKIALVSDCGSPLVADPGYLLVAAAHAHRIPVIPIPGPSAVIAALTAAGIPCDSFYLLGSLPSSSRLLTRHIVDAVKRDVPTVVLSTKDSLIRAVQTLATIVPRRFVVLACDLTKANERIIYGPSRQVSQHLSHMQGKDITMVLAGKSQSGWDKQTRNP